MEAYEEVVKSCRICRCEYSEDFVELLCNETLKLSAVGQLYEELLGLKINLETFNYLPQYLCKSCDLQISLFGELKLKALETAGMLRDFCQNAMQYQATSELEECGECNNFEEGEAIYANEMETITDCSIVAADVGEESWETTTETSELMVECVDEQLVKCELNEIEQTEDTTESTDKHHVDTEYVDVFYLDDALMQSNNDSVDNKSNVKQLNIQKKHKNSRLPQTFPCNECPKKFKTAESQQAHINIAHLKVPAYQCNLCPKTFNQKVHYQYHMDRHNNLRNFKCEICEKAFLSKTDLSIHMRFHRGDRPYKCEICGKDYSLMQHLKSHMYSHNPTREIMCRLCQQLFTNPTTLRTHMLTIHESPRFKCEYCVKRFRRKHHLIAHTKVHEKQFLRNDEEITQSTADEEEGSIIDDNGLSTEFTEENFHSDSLPSGVVENNIGEVFSITYSYEDFNTESYNDDDGFCENGQNILFN